MYYKSLSVKFSQSPIHSNRFVATKFSLGWVSIYPLACAGYYTERMDWVTINRIPQQTSSNSI